MLSVVVQFIVLDCLFLIIVSIKASIQRDAHKTDKVLTGTKISVLLFNPCSLNTVNTGVAILSLFSSKFLSFNTFSYSLPKYSIFIPYRPWKCPNYFDTPVTNTLYAMSTTSTDFEHNVMFSAMN